MPDSDRQYVVYVVPGIYPCSTGGMEIFYYKLLPEIAKKEDVTLITNCDKIKSESFNIIVVPNKILSIPGTGRFSSLIFTAIELIRIRKRIKIVHLPYTSNSGRWGFIFLVLKKVYGIKYLLHIHGGGMKKWKSFNADNALFKNASKILSVSGITRKEYEKRSGRNIEVVLPLVPFKSVSESKNTARKKLHISPQDKIILFVGSLKELKAPDVLLDAFIALGDKFITENRLKLIFVGGGYLQEELENKSKNSAVGNQVVLTGLIPYAEVSRYYKAADIYVIASHFEGTPKSLLEAMFNHLPIIATDVNGINNILEHNQNALLFERNNKDQLKENIQILVMDTAKAETLAKASSQRYEEKFTFENTLSQLFKIYNDSYSS